MSDEPGTLNAPRSWRDIPQDVRVRGVSEPGRRRYWLSIFKGVFAFAFIGGLVWGLIALVATIETNPGQVDQPPVRKMNVDTDGVLTNEWVFRTLGIPKSATLLELDLGKLQERLMASNQLRTATLSKQFPSTLRVVITERSPVARILAQDGTGNQRTLLVAKDGVVYEGECYEPAFIAQLPWLEGVRLVRRNGRFAPVPGMVALTELLTKVRYECEHLYPLFQFVSLDRLESDAEIVVRSPECLGLVFSTRQDYFKQLAYLDYIRDILAPTSEAPLARIDLTNSGEGIVPVVLQNAPVAANAGRLANAGKAVHSAKAGDTKAPVISAVNRAPVADYNAMRVPNAQSTLRAIPQRPASSTPAFSNIQRKSPQREL